MKRFILALGIALIALSFGGCKNGDAHLPGKAGEIFRKVTGHRAMTVNDKVTIYGTEVPPSAQLQCHENEHKEQAADVCYVNVKNGFIDDDDVSCTMQWAATYSNAYLQYGYNNRWELAAREACKDVK